MTKSKYGQAKALIQKYKDDFNYEQPLGVSFSSLKIQTMRTHNPNDTDIFLNAL